MKLSKLVQLTQEKLFSMLKRRFRNTCWFHPGEWLLVRGEAPVMLVAHLDTVHVVPVKDICVSSNGNMMMSPQGIGGDDRCGVYALLEVHRKAKEKPWLLFTCDEERGCIGARKFVRALSGLSCREDLEALKFIVEVDRQGASDAVYYDCANPDFEAFISGFGFETQLGSCSDISEIAPALGVAAVNISCGYYNPHILYEYIRVDELKWTIQRIWEMVDASLSKEVPYFEYVEYDYLLDEDMDWDVSTLNLSSGWWA